MARPETQYLFGKFSRGSRLKQESGFIRVTPDENAGDPPSKLADLLPIRELEGSFGVLRGRLEDGVLYEAALIEVVPPVLSGVIAGLVREGAFNAEELRPKVESAVRGLLGRPDEEAPPLARCALVVGHRRSAKGARSRDGLFEYDFNMALAHDVLDAVREAEVEIVERDNDPRGLRKLPAKVNRTNPGFILSLHCNAAAGAATGTETIHYPGSGRGRQLAGIVQGHLLRALELRDRGVKIPFNGRGEHLLKFTKAPCVICEPFFIDNDEDLHRALGRRDRLVAAYAEAIDEAAAAFTV